MSDTLLDRFDAKYIINQENGCWEWTDCLSQGYGKLNVNGKKLAAHRVSFELFNGIIPDGEGFHGVCVCHSCDNRKCVNPDHLFIGNHKDNMDDRDKKGRGKVPNTTGSLNGRSKLNEFQVSIIKKLLDSGLYYQGEIAEIFDVSRRCIGHIKTESKWRHV